MSSRPICRCSPNRGSRSTPMAAGSGRGDRRQGAGSPGGYGRRNVDSREFPVAVQHGASDDLAEPAEPSFAQGPGTPDQAAQRIRARDHHGEDRASAGVFAVDPGKQVERDGRSDDRGAADRSTRRGNDPGAERGGRADRERGQAVVTTNADGFVRAAVPARRPPENSSIVRGGTVPGPRPRRRPASEAGESEFLITCQHAGGREDRAADANCATYGLVGAATEVVFEFVDLPIP